MNVLNEHSFDTIVSSLFRLKSLKQLSLMSNWDSVAWDRLEYMSSNIEYLTISPMVCMFHDLSYIFGCAPHLKYLDIRLYAYEYSRNDTDDQPKKNIVPMHEPRTLL